MSIQTTAHLPEDVYERLRRAAFDRRVSQSAVITEALLAWSDAQNNEEHGQMNDHDGNERAYAAAAAAMARADIGTSGPVTSRDLDALARLAVDGAAPYI